MDVWGLGAFGEPGRRPPEPQRLGRACRTWAQPTAWLGYFASAGSAWPEHRGELLTAPWPLLCSPLHPAAWTAETRVAPGRPSPGSPARPRGGGRGGRGSLGPPRVWRKGPAGSSSHPRPYPPSLSAECCWKPVPSEAPEGLFPSQDPRRHGDPLLQDTPPSARTSSTDPMPAGMSAGADHCWQPRPRTSLPHSELLCPLSRPPEPRTLPTQSWLHSGPSPPAPQGGQPLPGEPGCLPPPWHIPPGRHSPPGCHGPWRISRALLPELGPPEAENKQLQKLHPTWPTAPSTLPWACRKEQTQTPSPALSLGGGPWEASARGDAGLRERCSSCLGGELLPPGLPQGHRVPGP